MGGVQPPTSDVVYPHPWVPQNMAEVTQNSVAAQADPAELDALAANARNAPALIQRQGFEREFGGTTEEL